MATLAVPPLKDHKEDIPELCSYFISRYNRETGNHVADLDPRCMRLIMEYDWPGNVRELRNAVIHACIFSEHGRINEALLVQNMKKDAPASGIPAAGMTADSDFVGRISKEQFVEALKKCRGNATRAAEMLGMARSSVYFNLKRFKLNTAEFRA
jgi:DNA-binding NtrC family response regulator